MQDNADRNSFVIVLIFWRINITDSVYPELVALVGATVPDYRGYFLRGVGGNSASLGERQGDAIKHPTTESVLHFWKSFENCWATGVFSIPNQSEYDVTIKESNSGHSFPRKLRFDLANAWESGYTAVETRPVNRAVRYLTRARWLAKLSESPYLKTQEGRQVLLTPTVPLRGVFFGTPQVTKHMFSHWTAPNSLHHC